MFALLKNHSKPCNTYIGMAFKMATFTFVCADALCDYLFDQFE